MKSSRHAKELRLYQTDAEKKFWMQVKDRRFLNLKFRRQVPIWNYILDFACFEIRLVVEIDGGQHCESASDLVRDRRLIEDGFTVKRYWNNEVLGNLEGIMTDLEAAAQLLKSRTLTQPSPIEGEGFRGESQ